MEIVQQYLDEAKYAMEKSCAYTKESFSKINAGRAVPAMVQSVQVDYYGHLTPLHQIATVSTIDPRTLSVQPWEPKSIPQIEKAIRESQLGFSAKNDGRVVVLTLPPPSEERRKQLAKLIKGEAEKGKVTIRNLRRDCKELLKASQKNGLSEDDIKRAEKKLQELTDLYITKVDELLVAKEADIMMM
ncbi:MAG: ribosome recycling factor [Amoebophilaceae bacterium]|nr:ribosome recycling factor [Amoebophilaceae bacterium]